MATQNVLPITNSEPNLLFSINPQDLISERISTLVSAKAHLLGDTVIHDLLPSDIKFQQALVTQAQLCGGDHNKRCSINEY